jgi:diguanylate cyclase (GGDEF)-like protein/putative nucleotidyltransferase with HDIG domain
MAFDTDVTHFPATQILETASTERALMLAREWLNTRFDVAALGIALVQDTEVCIFLSPSEAYSQPAGFCGSINQALRSNADLSVRQQRWLNPVLHEQLSADSCDLWPVASFLQWKMYAAEGLCGILFLFSAQPMTAEDTLFLNEWRSFIELAFIAHCRISQVSVYDKLTGVLNRDHLDLEFARLCQTAQRYDFPVSIALFDLDHFKHINDSWGHLVGDQVIREFACLVRAQARGSDIIGRYGGDEIVVVLPHCMVEGAVTFSSRIRRIISEHFFGTSEQRIQTTVSAGVAALNASISGESSHVQLFALADKALYKSKNLGRNRVSQSAETDALASDESERSVQAEAEVTQSVKVLVADDNAMLADLVSEYLSSSHQVDTCYAADEARRLISQDPGDYDVVVLDINFPGDNGINILNMTRSLPDPPMVVMMTGAATVEYAIESLRQGAYDFLPKPFPMKHMEHTVRQAAEVRQLRRDNQRYQQHLEAMVLARSKALNEALLETERSYRFTLEAMVRLLDERTDDTSEHSHRVRRLARVLGEACGLQGKELEDLDKGALLHDIGKLAIPDAVLHKAGPLNAEEWQIMRNHSTVGYEILRSNPYLRDAAEIVFAHHEKFNGTGYPRALKGDQICRGARIFAVIDVYDALRSLRAYKPAFSRESALREISVGVDIHFDPEIVAVFLSMIDQIEAEGRWPLS